MTTDIIPCLSHYKEDMKKIFSYKSFWIVFIIISAIIFASSLNFFRTYKSETNILIIPKNSATTAISSQIANNLSLIPHSNLFFEKLVENYPEIFNSLIDSLTSDAKKKYWEAELKTKVIKGSGIIRIAVYDKNQSRSENLAGIISKDLLKVAGNYYNTESDINIRTIDKPTTSRSTTYPIFALIAGSAGIGFLLTFAAFIFSLTGPKRNIVSAEKQYLKPIEKAFTSNNIAVKQENRAPIDYEVSEEEVKERLNKLLQENYENKT